MPYLSMLSIICTSEAKKRKEAEKLQREAEDLKEEAGIPAALEPLVTLCELLAVLDRTPVLIASHKGSGFIVGIPVCVSMYDHAKVKWINIQ
eukprot:3223003-Amphidinium_carterae.3